jgi:phosphotransferase system HPr (HPr) family protein
MKTVHVRVINEVGLHARTAAVFAAEAARFVSTIRVRSLTRDGGWVDAKSILTVLTLGVEQGHEIEITAEGPDEAEAAPALETLIRTDFAGRL